MGKPAGVKTSADFPVPDSMKAWVLGSQGELTLKRKPVPEPGAAEVLVRVDAVALCGSDIEVIASGSPALIEGGCHSARTGRPVMSTWARSQSWARE